MAVPSGAESPTICTAVVQSSLVDPRGRGCAAVFLWWGNYPQRTLCRTQTLEWRKTAEKLSFFCEYMRTVITPQSISSLWR